MSKEGLLIDLVKSGRSFAELHKSNSDNAEIEKKSTNFNELRDKFSRSKIKKDQKKAFRIESDKNLSRLEEEEIKQYLTELKKSFHKLQKYYDYDDINYKGIRSIENVFGEVNEDYYKPIKINVAFNENYIEFQSRVDKIKNLSEEEYLDMIRLYLRDIINDHEAPMRLKVHSRDKVIDYENQFDECKIQLAIQINFISSKDSEEALIWIKKIENTEIMMDSETDDIINELIDQNLKELEHQKE